MTCAHGFIGACAECDGSGQMPERSDEEVAAATPVRFKPFDEAAILRACISEEKARLKDYFQTAEGRSIARRNLADYEARLARLLEATA